MSNQSFYCDPRTLNIAIQSQAPVLILGETGTGKSTLARWIHDQSSRASAPFVTINLASLHEGTLESTLFGVKQGAFTGATHNQLGLIESAQGGTLFLDEIAELNPALQGRLLEVLQRKVIRPLGSTQERPVNFRLIAATHQNLETSTQEGRFRQDLFHRLRVVCLALSSLRDLPILDRSREILNLWNQIHPEKTISSTLLRLLLTAPFPGNYRELRSLLEYLSYSAQGSEAVTSDLPEWFLSKKNEVKPKKRSLKEEIRQFETCLIDQVLKKNQGHLKKTALEIGMTRSTLLRRLKKNTTPLNFFSPL